MKKLQKKEYKTPAAKKVRLEVKESVLGTCHSSPVLTPSEAFGCFYALTCWDGDGKWGTPP